MTQVIDRHLPSYWKSRGEVLSFLPRIDVVELGKPLLNIRDTTVQF